MSYRYGTVSQPGSHNKTTIFFLYPEGLTVDTSILMDEILCL